MTHNNFMFGPCRCKLLSLDSKQRANLYIKTQITFFRRVAFHNIDLISCSRIVTGHNWLVKNGIISNISVYLECSHRNDRMTLFLILHSLSKQWSFLVTNCILSKKTESAHNSFQQWISVSFDSFLFKRRVFH